MNYEARFYGRKVGSIGVCYLIITNTVGLTKQDARLSLYEEYEHISRLELIKLREFPKLC